LNLRLRPRAGDAGPTPDENEAAGGRT
jgi:hypothetical protein